MHIDVGKEHRNSKKLNFQEKSYYTEVIHGLRTLLEKILERTGSLPDYREEVINIVRDSDSEEGDDEEKRGGRVEATKKLKGIIENLQKLVKQNPNTKVEIKKGVEEAFWAIKFLEAEEKRRAKEKEEIGNTKSQADMMKVTDLKDQATQTTEIYDHTTTTTNTILDEENLQQEAIQDIGRFDSFELFEDIAWKSWPQEVFKKTKLTEGNPLSGENQADIAIIAVKKDIKEEKGIGKVLIERFPEINMAEEREIEGTSDAGISLITNTIGVVDREGNSTSRERWIFRIRTGQVEEPRKRAKTIFTILKELREILPLPL